MRAHGLESITNDRNCVVFTGKLCKIQNSRRKSFKRKIVALEIFLTVLFLSSLVDVCGRLCARLRGGLTGGSEYMGGTVYISTVRKSTASPFQPPLPPHPFSLVENMDSSFHHTTHFCVHRKFSHQMSWVSSCVGMHACRPKS